jgi:phenylacetate-CoA ligase
VIAHARERVPIYRRALAGIDPRRIRSLDDLLILPTFAKRDFRAAPFADRLARGRARLLLEMRTSGTTGEPFEIRRSLAEELAVALYAHRTWRRLGRRRGDRWVRLVGHHSEDPSWQARLVARLRRRFHRQVWVRQSDAALLQELRDAAPDVLTGYPGILARLAPLVGGDASGRIRPRLVVPGGEVLTAPMRELIAAGFGGAVRQVYGAYETGLMAWECAATGLLHVDDELVAVEILAGDRPASPGEEGEVYCTALHSFAMPILRFRIGDLATRGPSPCPCGYPGSTLAGIRGRRIDFYPLPDGRLLHHYELTAPIIGTPELRAWVARFQVVQQRRDRFVLRVAAADSTRAEPRERIRAELSRILGSGVELRLELVDELDFEPSGKFRWGRSLLGEAAADRTGRDLPATPVSPVDDRVVDDAGETAHQRAGE